ncbi:matrix-remodeling-associated protein 7 isoform X5 [Phyllostomus discolor]|uniref:Matrix-remodeling-associated protein 7 isoform X5 n=1 Tax=Phyllostomus discolor TaxID=89673 RepID=A0A7E6EGB7_9CHIR|nr:matrix-remodeling-associated protein 7 isoform X5 [Phyllostomus discolor]
MRFPKGLGSRPQSRSLQGAEKSGEGPGNVGLRPGRGWAGPGGSLGVPVGAHSSHRGAMEAPAELLAALPALATVLALLLAWLLVRRAQAASSDPAGASPEPVPRAEASGTSALHSPGAAPEPAAAPEEPGEPAGPAEAEEQAAEAKQQQEQQEQEQDPAEPEEEEEGGEAFSFKYSPGKLRGNQYKRMMTKEELEEEQRTEE